MAFKDLMNKVKGSFNRVAADFSEIAERTRRAGGFR